MASLRKVFWISSQATVSSSVTSRSSEKKSYYQQFTNYLVSIEEDFAEPLISFIGGDQNRPKRKVTVVNMYLPRGEKDVSRRKIA